MSYEPQGDPEPRSFEHVEPWKRKAELIGVDQPARIIELVVMPYEQETLVGWEGRMVRETICRGAFDGIERRANRVRANRDHEETRTFGRAVAFHPKRDEGLVAEIKVARTPLGDETLELADDGCLDASAGFVPMAGGLRWLSRQAYHVTRAWLRHVALVPEPAYEGARVLAVRSQTEAKSGTPNLDTVRSWRLDDRVASDPALNR